MTVLQVADLRFGYAGDVLFQNVTFSLALGERAAMVAPNGAGKSTLLRLIGKEIDPDAGSVVVKRDIKVGYYRQSHELKPEGDVLAAFLSGYGEVVQLREQLARAAEQAASGDERDLTRLAELQDRYHMTHGDELEREVSVIAERLGFSNADLERPVSSLSGGERGRLHLGVILAQKPDLLLLDEPTNHLDLDTIAWLETYLQSTRSAVLIVSHDRAFLDNVCTRTLELGTRGLRLYPLKYSDYVIARESDLERERAVVERQQSMIDKTEDFIRKNIAGQKTKQAQSRRKMLDKLDKLDRPEDVWQVAEKIAFRFAPAPRTGDIVLDCKGLGATRGGRVLFSGVELLVRRGERIGIVGPNGAGKTTLLKLLTSRGSSEDRGVVRRGTNLAEGIFDQHLGELDRSNTAVDEIRRIRGDFTTEVARQYLARFRFWGDDPLRVVSGFSGGEQARLSLAKLLLEPRNLLFLDEPTNHLDIPAAEILEEALASFEGTVFLVSHDRRFLENVATRIVHVREGRADIYPGGFRDFVHATRPRAPEPARREDAGRRTKPPERGTGLVGDMNVGYTVEARPGSVGAASRAKSHSKPPPPKPEAAKTNAYESQKQAGRERERRKKRIEELERSIATGEKDLVVIRGRLRSASSDDWEKLASMAVEEQALAKRLDAMMSEWAKLSEGGA